MYSSPVLLFKPLQDEAKKSLDPFYESQENHNLIGVANVFLEVLFHDVKLDYHTPIISQQGEVAGRLQVEITRIAGQMPQDRMCETSSENSHDSREDDFNQEPTSNQVSRHTQRLWASLCNPPPPPPPSLADNLPRHH